MENNLKKRIQKNKAFRFVKGVNNLAAAICERYHNKKETLISGPEPISHAR